jgi:hypothetical protein
MHAAGVAHRDCHMKNVLVTSLTGASATAVVADLSRARFLPRAGAVQLDVLAVVHMMLTLVVGVSFSAITRAYAAARAAAADQGFTSLEDSVRFAWPGLRALLQQFIRESLRADSALEPLRLQVARAVGTVILNNGGDLEDLRRALLPTAHPGTASEYAACATGSSPREELLQQLEGKNTRAASSDHDGTRHGASSRSLALFENGKTLKRAAAAASGAEDPDPLLVALPKKPCPPLPSRKTHN